MEVDGFTLFALISQDAPGKLHRFKTRAARMNCRHDPPRSTSPQVAYVDRYATLFLTGEGLSADDQVPPGARELPL